MFIAVTITMVLVCVLAWVIIKWLFPKMIRNPLTRKGGPIRILARYALEPRKAIYILKIGEKYLALASGDRVFTVLAELTETDLAAEWRDS